MSNKSIKISLISLGMILFFFVGLTHLFLLRFEAGDVYPVYSSLRNDPLGTRVLFESMNRLAEGSARRNFRPPDQLTLTPQTTLLICGLGTDGRFLKNRRFGILMDQVAVTGARVLLTFSTRLRKRDKTLDDEPCDQDCNCSECDDTAQAPEAGNGEEANEEWQGVADMGFEFMQSRSTEMDDTALLTGVGGQNLPNVIPWRTNLYFRLTDDAWQITYAWQDEPVVVRRPWGRGTIIMATDSYLFSNEALRNHRTSDLLAWMISPGNSVIFDEFHSGLARRPGIASLARQYRLHGVFGALLVMVALFIWRQSAVFVPPVKAERDSGDAAAGRDTGQGLMDLIRRHIASGELLTVCFQAWKPHGVQRVPEAVVSQIRTLIRQASENTKSNHPVKIYRQVCELLKQGRQR